MTSTAKVLRVVAKRPTAGFKFRVAMAANPTTMSAIDTNNTLHPVLPATATADPFARHSTPEHGHTRGHPATGRVPQHQPHPDLLLELAGVRIPVADTSELPPGAELSLKLTTTAAGTTLSMQAAPGTPRLPEVLAQALRAVLPKAGSLAALLPNLGPQALPAAASLEGAQPGPPPAGDGEIEAQLGAGRPGGTAASEPAQDGPSRPATGASASRQAPTAPTPSARLAAAELLPSERSVGPSGSGPTARLGTAEAPPQPLAATDPAARADSAPTTTTPRARDAGATTAAGDPRPAAPTTQSPGSGPLSGTGAHAAPTLPALAAEAPLGVAAAPARDQALGGAGASRLLATHGNPSGEGAANSPASATPSRFPDKVAEALASLAAQVPDVTTLHQAAGVATALQRSGLLLEAHLADPSAALAGHLEGDLKASLLMLQETVAQERALPAAVRPEPSVAESVNAPVIDAEAALKTLSDTVDGALARISLNQLQLAQAEPNQVSFSVELPVRLGNGSYEPVELIFEREPQAGATDQALTTLTLRMQPPELGPITAVLRLRGEHLSTELWAANPATRAQLFTERERLSAQLRAAGLDAPTVSVSQQAPARAVRLPQGLVNTTV